MNYCNSDDIIVHMSRLYQGLPEGVSFTIGEPKRDHPIPGWSSIGLKFHDKMQQFALDMNLDPSYAAVWDVFAPDRKKLHEVLKNACDRLGYECEPF